MKESGYYPMAEGNPPKGAGSPQRTASLICGFIFIQLTFARDSISKSSQRSMKMVLPSA
jgi:hypothetical protein